MSRPITRSMTRTNDIIVPVFLTIDEKVNHIHDTATSLPGKNTKQIFDTIQGFLDKKTEQGMSVENYATLMSFVNMNFHVIKINDGVYLRQIKKIFYDLRCLTTELLIVICDLNLPDEHPEFPEWACKLATELASEVITKINQFLDKI